TAFPCNIVENAPEPRLCGINSPTLGDREIRHRHTWRSQAPRTALIERDAIEERLYFLWWQRETGKAIPLLALVDALAGPELLHLCLGHQTGVVVLVALEGQAEAFDRIGDEADRLIRRCGGERLEDGL